MVNLEGNEAANVKWLGYCQWISNADDGFSTTAALTVIKRSYRYNITDFIQSLLEQLILGKLPAMARVAMSDPGLDKQCEDSDQSKISKRVAGNAVFQNKSAWT